MRVKDLPFPREDAKQFATDYKLPEDLSIENYTVPKDTVVKLCTTINFAWVVLPQGMFPKTIFSY